MRKTFAFFLFLFVLYACNPISVPSSQEGCVEPRIGCFAPDFTLVSSSSDVFSLSSQRGKVVVLNFWATWCGPCQSEMPDLQSLYESYQSKNVLILGINDEDTANEIIDFGDDFGLTFPLLIDGNSVVSVDYQIEAYPTSFFIDENGIIYDVHIGSMTYQELESAIMQLDSFSVIDTQIPTTQEKITRVKGCVTAEALNVRSSPTTDAPVIDWFNKNECFFFDARSSDNNWVRLESQTGWVSAKWIKFNDDMLTLPISIE